MSLTGSLITISIIGLAAGFIFSMPIAGPISILVTSNALKGRLKYCNLLALGASFADFIYVLVAVYGITHLFSAYKQVIPYILAAGSILLFFVGIRIIRTKFDLEHIDEETRLAEGKGTKIHGALYTGFMINFLNPTLFFGWMLSSFVALSFAASLGFNTGGLNSVVDQNLNQIQNIEGKISQKPQIPSYLKFDTLKILKKMETNPVRKPVKLPRNYHFLTSLFYSVSLAAGGFLWFSQLSLLLVRFRRKIDINILNWIVRIMGIILCFFALFFGYSAVKMFI
ncbi:MAG: LysE family transporter [Bacteroidales bacterium]|jgi:threonine/homoserine/homoserine lactone efflux protein